jgi:aspartate kinase
VHEEFERLRAELKNVTPEYVVSRGEWFTAKLMAEFLGLPFVDATEVIVFHHDGTIDMERTQTRLREAQIHTGGTGRSAHFSRATLSISGEASQQISS